MDSLRSSLAGALPSGMGSGVVQQADAFWKMLDGLSEDDPDRYKAFINQTLQAGPDRAGTSSSRADDRPQAHMILTLAVKPEEMERGTRRVRVTSVAVGLLQDICADVPGDLRAVSQKRIMSFQCAHVEGIACDV
jgi:hypothetical protein